MTPMRVAIVFASATLRPGAFASTCRVHGCGEVLNGCERPSGRLAEKVRQSTVVLLDCFGPIISVELEESLDGDLTGVLPALVSS